MKVLIVARCKKGEYAPFIKEQVNALLTQGIEVEYFAIHSGRIGGYIKEWPRLKKTIKIYKPDIIHAHYGLSGLLANLQRKVPVVTTYHGSDINNPKIRPFSKFSIIRSAFNIFVSQKMVDIVKPKSRYVLIPCGINLEDYPIIDKSEARRIMGLDSNIKYVLFAGAFDNKVKNAPLAKSAMGYIPKTKLLELKGYSRSSVCMLMQAVDAFLMTSFTEGSPQVIKEAMACGCPIVSVDVGDVRERLKDLDGCYITDYSPESISNCLKKAIAYQGRTKGRESIITNNLLNSTIVSSIVKVYTRVLRDER